jgi:hypothetical protein
VAQSLDSKAIVEAMAYLALPAAVVEISTVALHRILRRAHHTTCLSVLAVDNRMAILPTVAEDEEVLSMALVAAAGVRITHVADTFLSTTATLKQVSSRTTRTFIPRITRMFLHPQI